MTIHKAIARAWTDAEFRAKLKKDPNAALNEEGVGVPPRLTVKVVEDTPATAHIVVPVAPVNASQLTREQLERIAAGATDLSRFGLDVGGSSNV